MRGVNSDVEYRRGVLLVTGGHDEGYGLNGCTRSWFESQGGHINPPYQWQNGGVRF